MKRFSTLFLAAVTTVAAVAQTLNVEVGSVTYQIPAAQAGQMIYSDASSVTILNKVYAIAHNIVVEWGDAVGVPFVFGVHYGVDLFV